MRPSNTVINEPTAIPELSAFARKHFDPSAIDSNLIDGRQMSRIAGEARHAQSKTDDIRFSSGTPSTQAKKWLHRREHDYVTAEIWEAQRAREALTLANKAHKKAQAAARKADKAAHATERKIEEAAEADRKKVAQGEAAG